MDHGELGRAELRPEEHGRQDRIRQVVWNKLPGNDVGELLSELLEVAGRRSLHSARRPSTTSMVVRRASRRRRRSPRGLRVGEGASHG